MSELTPGDELRRAIKQERARLAGLDAERAAAAARLASLEAPAIERSGSGNGAHVWVFFAAPVPASAARIMGCCLITETMSHHHQLAMDSYDRLFPNQDTLPRGGFGNLIACPSSGSRGSTATRSSWTTPFSPTPSATDVREAPPHLPSHRLRAWRSAAGLRRARRLGERFRGPRVTAGAPGRTVWDAAVPTP